MLIYMQQTLNYLFVSKTLTEQQLNELVSQGEIKEIKTTKYLKIL
jgi:hypothetical protein